MPSRPVGITDTGIGTGIADIDVMERPSSDIATTTTADPGSGGTTLAVTLRDLFPQSGTFKIRVENEIMYVTAGHGSGAGSFTVTRGQDGTTAVAHTAGVAVWYIVGVQRVEVIDGSRIITYKGRANTFRTPGRAGTAGQKILSIHNATGSPVKCRVNKMWVDVVHAAAAGVAPTVIPPIIRMWKVTVVPTNGNTLTKVPMDSSFTSDASITVRGDSSADGTGSTTTLTATLPAGTILTEEYGPRVLVVGTSASTFYEMFDRETFLDSDLDYVTLNALEGVVLFLDYTVATANPTSDHWIAGVEWEEYRVA